MEGLNEHLHDDGPDPQKLEQLREPCCLHSLPIGAMIIPIQQTYGGGVPGFHAMQKYSKARQQDKWAPRSGTDEGINSNLPHQRMTKINNEQRDNR